MVEPNGFDHEAGIEGFQSELQTLLPITMDKRRKTPAVVTGQVRQGPSGLRAICTVEDF